MRHSAMRELRVQHHDLAEMGEEDNAKDDKVQ